MMKGILYLLPNTLGNPDTDLTIPSGITKIIPELEIYIVENLRNARRYLKKLSPGIRFDNLQFFELNKHTDRDEIPDFLEGAMKGAHTAILSEAGVPGVADPGAEVVKMAHEKGIRVIPLSGPSSVILALMASGLNGQAFRFHGYLPIRKGERIRTIHRLEQLIDHGKETQIFIEAPYRNNALLNDILENCSPSTLLCIGVDLTQDSESIRTLPVETWKKINMDLHKRPAIFLLGKR